MQHTNNSQHKKTYQSIVKCTISKIPVRSQIEETTQHRQSLTSTNNPTPYPGTPEMVFFGRAQCNKQGKTKDTSIEKNKQQDV